MLITGIAKADEKTITPQEFGQAITEVPSKVSNFVKSEVSKTKEYQKKVLVTLSLLMKRRSTRRF